jgi:TolB-like protein
VLTFLTILLLSAADNLLILDLRPQGVSAEVAAAVTSQVAELLSQRSDYRVLTLSDLDDAVRQQKSLQTLGCEDGSCMAELSRLAKTKRVVTGSVGKIGAQYLVTLSLIDSAEARVLAKADARMPSLEKAQDALTALLSQLLGGGATTKTAYKLPGGRQTSFAVFDLKPLGITTDVAVNLTQVLAAEIKRIEGTRVISRDDIASMLALESKKDALGCSDSVTCLAEIGGALGVDKLVVGSVGKIESSFVVSLRMIDAKRSVVDNRVTETFQGQTEQLLPAVRATGRRLLGVVPKDAGGLTIATNELQADIYVNDKSIGVSPLPPLRALPPGKHNLRLKKAGFADWRSDIFVEPGEMTALWAPIVGLPTPWYKTWWFWTIAGGVVAGAAIATTVVVLGGNNGTLRVAYTRDAQ